MLVRKTVTALFSDVVMSTELGERLDPESLRRVMTQWFDEMRLVIERHGGTVEKFIGDEIMAVFGVPTVHEDDALRAVRAAAQMRERLAELNEELQATWGVQLEARTGINTGQVVAGDPATGGTFVTGEAVVLAKRLEQAAGPGEILIGKATYPLVRDAVKAGPLESFPVKGKSEPVAPLRLDEVEQSAPGLARKLDAPLVGRHAELAQLLEAVEESVRESSCRLLTVLGPAGIGKSRLAAELRARLGERTTWLNGRCLPYGEGITFWPLAQIVREAGGEEAIARTLDGQDDADQILELIRAAIGAAHAPGGGEETFWAVRRMLEALADARPLVVCLEDIHWAESTFLDLIEYLAGWIRGAPILLLCLARPDLLEKQPAWATPRRGASLIGLDPLSRPEADALLGELQCGVSLSEPVRERIAAASEGNPLFVEQMVAMVCEEGATRAEQALPPSIQALLAERLDRLSAEERAVVERASVIGKEFFRREVVDLCPPELRGFVSHHLMALVRKELIRPDTSAAARDDGFRFRHVLIRDAAYEGLPKEIRAELHERFATWLEARPSAAELEEIVGYHLEQAFRYREQLGPVDEAERALAARGGELLASAGRRALTRGDMPAAVSLLSRATILLRDEDRERLGLAPDLAVARMRTGEPLQAEWLLSQAIEAATAVGDRRNEAHALVVRARVRLATEPEAPTAEARSEAERAIQTFDELGDELGLAKALHLLGDIELEEGRYAAAEATLRRAVTHHERAGQAGATILTRLVDSIFLGPTPVEDAIREIDGILERAEGRRALGATTLAIVASLHAMRGRFDVAREFAARSTATADDTGARILMARVRILTGSVELLAGDAAAAERELRRAHELCRGLGETGEGFRAAAGLARALCLQARHDEAARYVDIDRDAAPHGDPAAEIEWHSVAARVLAALGDLEQAEAAARKAVERAETTDGLNLHADALLELAHVLESADRAAEAVPGLEEAVRLYDAKGNHVSRAEAKRLLAELHRTPPVAPLDN